MGSRDVLALSILILFLLRWVEYWALRRSGPRERVVSRWNTVLTLAFGSIVWSIAVLEAWLGEGEPVWWLSGIGVGLYAIRSVLKAVSVRALGRAWSTEIEIKEDHRLVREGPYRWVRHPIYLCNLLEPISVALFANAWIAGLLGVFLMWPILFLRLRREEQVLEDKFGDAYAEYRQTVPALFPWPSGRR